MKRLEDMSLEELWQLFPIFLVPYDENMKEIFAREKARIISFCNKNADDVVHIGSTAIGNIATKNIIDILLLCDSREDMQRIRDFCAQNGYIVMNETKERISLNRGYTPQGFAKEVFHLHLRLKGDDDEIYFCRYMREHPEDAKLYEKLKLSLLPRFEHDRDGYTCAKTQFVKKYTDIAKKLYKD